MPNLNIEKQPGLLSASENPMLIQLSTDNNGREPLRAKFQITNAAGTTNPGDRITFYFRKPQFISKTFTASSYPTSQGEFYASTITSPTNGTSKSVTNEQISIDLVEKFRQDAFIGLYYDINYYGGSIVFTAKSAGSEFTLISTSNDEFDGNSNVVYSNRTEYARSSINSGSSPIEGENIKNYSLYVDVYANANKNVQLYGSEPIVNQDFLGSLRKPFIKNGENLVEFDISTILKNFVSTELPDLSKSNIGKVNGETFATAPIVNYTVEYGEYAPISDTIDGVIQQKAPKGTIKNKAVANAAVDYGSSYNNYYPISQFSHLFMTDQPNAKLSHPSIAYDGLYYTYINKEPVDSVDFERLITYNYYDGTSAESSLGVDTFTNKDLYIDPGFEDGLTQWSTSGITDTDSTWSSTQGSLFDGDPYAFVFATNSSHTPVLYQDFGTVLNDQTSLSASFRLINDSGALLKIELLGWNGSSWTVLGSSAGLTGSTEQDVAIFASTGFITSYDFIGIAIQTFSGNDVGTFAVNITDLKLYTSTSESINGVYNFDVSPANVGINESGENNSKRVKSYEIQLSASTTGSSVSTQEYFLPYDIAPKGTTVLWQNPLGGYDSFYFTGIREDGLNRTSDDFETIVNKNFPDGFQKNKEFNIEGTDTISLNSGWIKEDHFDWMKEILTSPKVYIAVNNDLFYYIIDGFQYTKNNQNNQFNIELTLVKTIENNNITE